MTTIKRRTFLGGCLAALASPLALLAPRKTEAKPFFPPELEYRPIRGITLSPAQANFVYNHSAMKAFQGGLASGKTTAGSYDILHRSQAGKRYLVLAPTYAMLQDSTQRRFIEIAEQCDLWSQRRFSKCDNHVTLRNGADVFFRSWDSFQDCGLRCNGVWMDEMTNLGTYDWDSIQGLFSEWVTMTFTPMRSHNRLINENNRPWPTPTALRRWHITCAPTKDNPFLPREFTERLEASFKEHSPKRFNQQLNAAWK